jgi:hypothetical protein
MLDASLAKKILIPSTGNFCYCHPATVPLTQDAQPQQFFSHALDAALLSFLHSHPWVAHAPPWRGVLQATQRARTKSMDLLDQF